MRHSWFLSTAACAAMGLGACAQGRDEVRSETPREVRMTWFGITNWHYQVGELGILLDGAVGFPAPEPDAAMVARVHEALRLRGDVDVVLLGHLHGDHSVDTPEWATQTDAQLYASQDACGEAVAYGVAPDRCTALRGGETFELDPFVTMRVVRWVHSVPCGQSANGGGIETFGFFFTAQTPERTLSWYVTDSGAGGPDLTTEQMSDGVSYGAPLANLETAVRSAGLDGFEVWQGGPESRVINQARTLVPQFDVRYFMPHHSGARGGFDILGGLHYAFDEDETPKLTEFLAAANVPQIHSSNYFDAYVYDAGGVRRVENAAVKAALGLPASGPGPAAQGANPRAGQLECPSD